MTNKISRTVPFDENVINNIANFPAIYDNEKFNPKINRIIKTLANMYTKTKIELKNYFLEREAELIAEITENDRVSSSISSKTFLIEKINEIALLNNRLPFNVDKDVILTKIDNLTEFQAYTVLNMSYEYHSSKKEKSICDIFLIR